MNGKFTLRKAPLVFISVFLLLWPGIVLGEPLRVLEQACSICLSYIDTGQLDGIA